MQVSKPSISSREKENVTNAVNMGDIGIGHYITQFEQSWAIFNRMSYGIACDNGTNALFLALKALKIGPGDEVIVPEFTMIASAWAVTYTGATPVFVDCADDLNIDVDKIEKKITNKTRAIMPVHIYGRQCNMDRIIFLAGKYNLFVIEDSAEAHGIIPRGDIVCYSFYGNKIITTGSGGMCLTNSKEIAEEIRLLTNMYFNKDHTFLHPKTGYNFRMTNIQAAIGCAQVIRTKELLAKRKEIEGWYDNYLPHRFLMPKRDVVWVYDIDCGHDQEKIRLKLERKDIETRVFFKPMSMQPMYLSENYEKLNAFKWSQRGIYLPMYPDMILTDVIKIADILKS